MKALVRDVGTLVEFAPTNWLSVDFTNLVKTSTLRQPKGSDSELAEGKKDTKGKMRLSRPLSGRVHTASVSSKVSLAIVCSFMYGLGLSAIGIGFSVSYLLMSPSKLFDSNIYHGYSLFLFMGGICLQGALVIRKIVSLIDGIRLARGLESEVSFKAFGTFGFRLLIALVGVVSSFWFLLEFSWNLDSSRVHSQCSDRRIEITVLAMAMFYSLIHLHVIFYNTKLLLQGFDIVTLFGLMHLVGTNVTTYCWASAHFILLTLARYSEGPKELCDSVSVLAHVVANCHPYLGPILLQFLLMSTALLVSIFLHYKRYGSFCIQSRLDEMVSAASHVMRFSSNSLGLIMVALLVAGTVTFVVYHYLLISWKLANTAWLTMEVISTLLAILSFSCNVALMVVNRYSPFDSLFRDIQLEGLVLTVGLVGALLHELFYLIGAVRLTNEESVASWAVAASVVKIVDSMAQTTLLLQTLRVFATFLTGKKFAVQQSFVIYLSFSNVAFALLNFIRQGEEIYGRIHLTAHGFLFWAVVRFIFSSFAILFRLFSSVSFASLWLRSFEG